MNDHFLDFNDHRLAMLLISLALILFLSGCSIAWVSDEYIQGPSIYEEQGHTESETDEAAPPPNPLKLINDPWS